MAKLAIKKASTDVTVYLFIQDSSKTTGVGLAGLAYNTGSLVGYYVRPKGSATAITLATQTVTGDHSDGGFVEIDATNMPGVYRLDLPDAVCATGVPSVVVMLKGATNMSPVVLEIQLTDFDLNTAAITAAAVADAVWDEATADHTTASSFGALDANVDAILADTGTDGVVLKAAGLNADAVAEIADGVWDEAISGHTTATTFGGKNQKVVPSETIGDYKADVSGIPAAVWGYATRTLSSFGSLIADIWSHVTRTLSSFGFTVATNSDANVTAIKAKTDNLPASPAAVGSAMTLTAAYDKAKDDVLTPLGVVDGIVDAIKVQTDKIPATPASAGEYTANIGAIKAKTDNLPLSPASSGEYTSALTAIQNDLDNPSQYKADVSNLALQATSLAIKGQTDKIPAAPAQTGEYNAALTAIQADLDNPTQYKADVSALMLASSYVAPNNAGITAIKAKTDNLPANTATALAAIQSDLDNPTQYKADVSALATQASVNAIPTTPLLAANYTAPDNATIGEIKAKTDQLTFTVPNKVDSSAVIDPTGIATSDDLDIIGGKVDGVLNKLNISSVEYVTAVVGSTITILRGDTLSARLLDLGDLTDYASIDFTVKRVAGELDDAAKIRLRKNASGTDDGLLRLNGESHTLPTDGSIVIDDLTTGDIEIKLKAAATQDLIPGNYVYDVQIITANEVRTLTTGKATVTADVTRATV